MATIQDRINNLIDRFAQLKSIEDKAHIIHEHTHVELNDDYERSVRDYFEENPNDIEELEAREKELEKFEKKDVAEQERVVRATEDQGVEWGHLNLYPEDFSPKTWHEICDVLNKGHNNHSVTVAFPKCLVEVDE